MIRRAASLLGVSLLVLFAPSAQADEPTEPSRIETDSTDELDEFDEAPAEEKKGEPAKKPADKADEEPAEPPPTPATDKAAPAPKADPAPAPAPKADPAPAPAPAPKADPAPAPAPKADPAPAPAPKADPAPAPAPKADPAPAPAPRVNPAPAEKILTPTKGLPAEVEVKEGPAPNEGPEVKEGPAPNEGPEVKEEASEEEEEEASEEEEEEAEPFVEGELAAVGALGFVPWRNRIGTVISVDQIGEIAYLGIKPTVNYSTKLWDRPLSLTFGVPLRIELVDARVDKRFNNTGRFREEDWDEVSDFFQIINAITFGGKESRIYVDINAFKSTSIGHGTLMKRYNPNLNFNTARVQAEVDAFIDYVGGELYVDNIPAPNVLGGLLFIKPLSFINRDNYALRSFSIGAQLFTDINAPVRNILDFQDADNDGRRWSEIAVDQDTFQPQHTKSSVLAYGLDLEIKLVDERWLDWKTYFDYSFLETGVPVVEQPMSDCNKADVPGCLPYSRMSANEAGVYSQVETSAVRSGGFTWGNLFRMNFGQDTVHALRIRTEYRYHDPNYVPSYFDSMYDVQRLQHPASDDLVNSTKLIQVLGRSADGPGVNGGYFELSYSVERFFAMSIGLEINDQTPDNALFVHLEVPELGPWGLIATYSRRNSPTFDELFDVAFKPTDWFLLQTRFSIVDIMNVALEVVTPFGIGTESLFRNVVQVNFVMEFGFEYL